MSDVEEKALARRGDGYLDVEERKLATLEKPKQLELLRVQENEVRESERARGVHTAEGMRKNEPERFELIAGMIVEGSLSERQIARGSRCSRNIVAAIRRKIENGELGEMLERVTNLAKSIANLSGEAILERLASGEAQIMPMRDLIYVFGWSTDKARAGSGRPTQIVEHQEVPTHLEFLRALEAARAQGELPPWGEDEEDAEVVEKREGE
jgi:hypothetical protein